MMIQESLQKIEQVETRTNPFPGLRPFELHESYLFFGRDGQSEQLISKLARSRFLAVVGTSGSGKSSLVRAGLLPSLLTGFMNSAGSSWRMAIMRPGSDPIGNLARALNDPEVFGSEHGENRAIQIAITEATLRRGTMGLVDVVTQNIMPATDNLLVLADQFEEIFRFAQTTKDSRYENDAAAFVKLLLEASRQTAVNIYVVLTMRSDYLGDCAQFQDLPEAINEAQYLIPRLTRDQRREAIEGPVAVAGGEITPRLVNRLLNDVGDNPDQLPILQHALMRTWDECENKKPEHKAVHQGKALDQCCYETIGGMAEALSLHADEAFNELPDERSRLICEKLFKCLTEKGVDNREIRRPVTLGEACAIVEAGEQEVIGVVEPFRKQGRTFLMPPAEVQLNSESLIDISHESLIRNWKQLRAWVEEEARSVRIYRRLAETAELHREGRAGLWGDPDLQLALDWQKKNSPNKEWAQHYSANFDTAIAFLHASERKRADDLAQIERQKMEDIELKRERERARWLWRGFLVLLVLVIALSWNVYQRIQIGEKTDEIQQRTELIKEIDKLSPGLVEKAVSKIVETDPTSANLLPLTDKTSVNKAVDKVDKKEIQGYRSKLDKAKEREREGFEQLLSGNYDEAIKAFEASEKEFNSYHQVYELARLIKQKKADLNDPEKQKEVFQLIVKKYSYGAPPDLLKRIEERSK